MDNGLDGQLGRTGELVDVGLVHAGCSDADQCLARLRNRHRDVIEAKELRSAVGVKSKGFHGSGDG
jgi:hypothetical protein